MINNAPPLKLFVDDEKTPVAVHKAAPILIHWNDKVKRELDSDVAMGVVEKVPPNTPVTWCS